VSRFRAGRQVIRLQRALWTCIAAAAWMGAVYLAALLALNPPYWS
jgi:hypothetical protein